MASTFGDPDDSEYEWRWDPETQKMTRCRRDAQRSPNIVIIDPGAAMFFGGPLTWSFLDVSNLDAMCPPQEFAKTAPRWFIAKPGLNLLGECTTSGCAAEGKQVINPVGFHINGYDLRLEEPVMPCCPICQNHINPVNVGFTSCQWRFEGKYMADKMVTVSCDWRRCENKWYTFDVKKAGEREWRSLIIFTKQL